MAGTGKSSAEIQVSVLAVDAVRDGELVLAKEKKPVRAVLVQDVLFLFSDVKDGRQLKRRVTLGVTARYGVSGSEIRIDEPGTKEEIVLRAASDADAAEWASALRPFIGSVPNPCFGVALAELLEREIHSSGGCYQTLPRCVEALVDFIAEKGLEEPGVFRVSCTEMEIDDAIRRIEVGGPVVSPFDTVHIAANVLKRFLRLVPECILTTELCPKFLDAPQKDVALTVAELNKLVWLLPEANRDVLKATMRLAHEVSKRAKVNMMDAKNLGIVLGPSLVWQSAGDALKVLASANKIGLLAEIMTTHFPAIFESSGGGAQKVAAPIAAAAAAASRGAPPASAKPILGLSAPPQRPPPMPAQVAVAAAAAVTPAEAHIPGAPRKPLPRPHVPLHIVPLDARDDDAAIAQATEVFRSYSDASGVMLEAGFLAFYTDLSAMPKAKKITRQDAAKLYTAVAPDKRLSCEAFATWWKNAHATFLPL
jgi:hypothetical protein